MVGPEYCIPEGEEGRVIALVMGVMEVMVGSRGAERHQSERRPREVVAGVGVYIFQDPVGLPDMLGH